MAIWTNRGTGALMKMETRSGSDEFAQKRSVPVKCFEELFHERVTSTVLFHVEELNRRKTANIVYLRTSCLSEKNGNQGSMRNCLHSQHCEGRCTESLRTIEPVVGVGALHDNSSFYGKRSVIDIASCDLSCRTNHSCFGEMEAAYSVQRIMGKADK